MQSPVEVAFKLLAQKLEQDDLPGFLIEAVAIQERYGDKVASEAFFRLMGEFPFVSKLILDRLKDVMPEAGADLEANSFDAIAHILVDAGLKVEEHFRVTDEGSFLTKDAIGAIAATGFPAIKVFGEGHDSLEGVGIDRSNGFRHPLCNGNLANSWDIVSLLISATYGWYKYRYRLESKYGIDSFNQQDDSRIKSLGELACLVKLADPNADFSTLVNRALYDDRALLMLCSLANAGFEEGVQSE